MNMQYSTMDVILYIKESEAEIASFYNLMSNPFKVGDTLQLSVSNRQTPFNIHGDIFRPEDLEELSNTFHLRDVKIISENKYIKLTLDAAPRLTIEYFCEFID